MINSESTPKESPAFARKAGSYDAHAGVQADAAQWLAEWLPQEASLGRCLELGAGTGLFSRYLTTRAKKLECTDISSEMLEYCRERLPDATYRVLDAWEAPSLDVPRWDTLCSSSLLQWTLSPVETLENWSKRLERNGRMLLGFFTAPSLPELDRVLNGTSPVQWRSQRDWVNAMRAAGLQIQRIESQTRCYHYPSALQFWRSLHGTGSNVSRGLTAGTLRRLLRDYETAFATADGVAATWTFCRSELNRTKSTFRE